MNTLQVKCSSCFREVNIWPPEVVDNSWVCKACEFKPHILLRKIKVLENKMFNLERKLNEIK